MHQYFVSHFNHQNQIGQTYATQSLIIIFSILIFFIFVSFRKKKEANDFLSVDTSVTLRGIAILFILFGHFAIKCIEGRYFFEFAGRWAVTIFLFLSGIALYKTYGLSGIDGTYILKRIRRLAFPTWLTVATFYLLDFILLKNEYSPMQILLNFLGILTPNPPNGPVWYITYILFLYLVYFLVSKIKASELSKVAVLFFICGLSALIIFKNDILRKNFAIWIPYTLVFPTSVLIGVYSSRIRTVLKKISQYPILYLLLSSFFTYQFITGVGFYSISKFFNSWICFLIIHTVAPLSFVVTLLMVVYFLDQFAYYSRLLSWLGSYSFEIYLLHMPFMVYYDFFLFREPLSVFFYVYVLFILLLSIAFGNVSNVLTQFFFDKFAFVISKVLMRT